MQSTASEADDGTMDGTLKCHLRGPTVSVLIAGEYEYASMDMAGLRDGPSCRAASRHVEWDHLGCRGAGDPIYSLLSSCVLVSV
jgi:hypothetical protein